MNILFICKYNRFRSKVAEAYFKKINKNKNIKVKSAGLFELDKPLSSTENLRNKIIKNNFGLIIKGGSKGIRVSELEKSDKIIVVASDIPRIVFNHPEDKKKVEFWKAVDDTKGEEARINKTVKFIIKRVDRLIKKLK